MQHTRRKPTSLAAAAALAVVGVSVLGACSSDDGGSGSGDGSTDAAGGTYTWWDPYPQHDGSSDWEARVQACGEEAGVTIERTAYDTTALTNQALLSAQEGTSPDVILIDNPAVSTLADTGILTTVEEFGLDTSAIDQNLLDAGVVDGEAYGIPIGANTLSLYYNADILSDAGVDPASITDWDSLTAALAQVTDAGHKGITFAGIGTEEGSFQFLPWFWGAGADLTDLDSPEAVEALELWKGWLDQGYAPNTVINNSQNTVWEEFLTGDFAFAENGTWQVNSAAEAEFETGIVQLPAQDGGVAPAPTGGEFIVAPVQEDTARYEVTRQIVECMTTPEGFVETANTFAYYIPPTAEGQEQLLAESGEDADLEPWVEAVQNAKGRTSDGLGTDYPVISEALWTAVQNALSGAATPAEALETAQADAEAATS
ncbi:multiple sugar transport system substrate-binding protein [Isoptericola sp. CG 20/1183]|uniref:Multiple sugar transport system substrate-binding protein n=1 Tax=Isoptericola halotolerans TaxID=300560 RepID=A0ABX5EGS1_9MICO|nr:MULTISPECIES: extracellular solute-binding protein [Isoptericola]PRZ08697.1 multiple sugar transport system substrate-binding protein [Isoptericola halotolerans]PRZ10856.1 multiple sugar transport system substrate-binding protein [Isoptericola sp. CG 20/1183]